ncbi:MAG TPA: hypothetical protein VF470_04795, partial [Sphingomicrobium sp.]
MHQFAKRIFAAAAPLLLTGCLWGPGKFTSDLTLKKDGSFVLDYKGEIVLQTPPDDLALDPWKDENASCQDEAERSAPAKTRPCTKDEIAKQRAEYEKRAAENAERKKKENVEMAKMFGLAGLDDQSANAFAAKLGKYAGYRSVTYRGKGVYDVDYHFEGRATQDFVFPALPDNDVIIPFIAMRRRSDGSVLVTAPAFTGGSGPLGTRAGASAAGAMKGGPVSKAQG